VQRVAVRHILSPRYRATQNKDFPIATLPGDSLQPAAFCSGASQDWNGIVETHTITLRTGRFTGAQGRIRFDRLHKLAASDDGTHLIFGSLQGTITFPGDTH